MLNYRPFEILLLLICCCNIIVMVDMSTTVGYDLC